MTEPAQLTLDDDADLEHGDFGEWMLNLPPVPEPKPLPPAPVIPPTKKDDA
jgi:hypothetical protein